MKLYWGEVGGDFITLPPFKSDTDNSNIQRSFNANFNPLSYADFLEIQNFLLIKNQRFTSEESTNINNRLVADHTCWVEDDYGAQYKALVTISSSNSNNTRFYNCGKWNGNGRDFSLQVREVV